MGGQITNRVSTGKRDGGFKRIRGIPVSFFGSKTIINAHGRELKI